jgi:hypothetical protein
MHRPQFSLRYLFVLTAAFATGLAIGPRVAQHAWPMIEREIKARQSAQLIDEVFMARNRPITPEDREFWNQYWEREKAELAKFLAEPPSE